jgi:hypothetical protein
MRDTINLWHISEDTLEIEVLEDGTPFDTVTILPYVQEDQSIAVSLRSKNRHPDNPMDFEVSTPVASVNKQMFSVSLGDTIELTSFTVDTDPSSPLKVLLKAKWADKANYYVRLLPGAITDVFGNVNDTMLFVVSFDERINFGELNLTITGLDSTLQYLVSLMDNQSAIKERVISSTSEHVLVFTRMAAKEYNAKIVEDRNRNGIWDTGDFETKRQPERIFMKKLEGMRPGWDLDLTIIWPEK